MKRTSQGVVIRLQRWSLEDVSLEIGMSLAIGVCVAAIVGWWL
jgi:hypothetical protein